MVEDRNDYAIWDKEYTKVTKSINASCFLSALLFDWKQNGKKPFAKIDKEYVDDLDVNVGTVKRAKKLLIDLGIISVEYDFVSRISIYTVHEDALEKLMNDTPEPTVPSYRYENFG